MPAQLSLLQEGPLGPLPTDCWHYVPALQNKPGELDALRDASEETWSRMTPVIHLVGPRKKRSKPFRSQTIADWVKRVAAAVGCHPVYLDVMRLDPVSPVETTKGTVPLLTHVYASARKRGVRFVPVAWVGECTEAHLEAVADAAAADCRGVAVRFRFLRTMPLPGTTRSAMLIDLLHRLDCDMSSADLLLDLEYLDPDEDLSAEDIAASIEEMAAVGPWRSIALLGSSIPDMLGSIPEGTLGSLLRREWKLWTQLHQCQLSRLPAFGDYAIQHPRPPTEGGGPGMRANIRYTAGDETLVVRGKGSVLQEGKEQYIELCQQMFSRAEFLGAAYTAGDGIIADCANGTIEPGAQRMWRGAGTSHHLRVVTDQLQELRGGHP
ncbi:MAG TPA: hypothetical protein VKX16_07815 [Chloroflexota bacterium]|nr:hypothetical protein [Chloroflexota bacterium]